MFDPQMYISEEHIIRRNSIVTFIRFLVVHHEL